jgi:asparagine synthase (glutamine-hydrolysing)
MCGIYGYIGIFPTDAERLMKKMHARGPDAFNLYKYNDLTIAHSRLSFCDLSPMGDQPFTYAHEQVIVCVNGEIYNHLDLISRFNLDQSEMRGRSDCEVLGLLYLKFGVDWSFLLEIEGMFSFSIYDKRNGMLYLGRDVFGMKPMFYGHTKSGFKFASQINYFDNIDFDGVSQEALADFSILGMIPSPKTIYSNIFKVEPGQIVSWKNSTLTLTKYPYSQDILRSSLSDRAKIRNLDAYTLELEEKLQISAQQCLSADVPIASLLSGGLDSNVLTYIGSEKKLIENCYTVRNPDTKRDEFTNAALAAKAYNIQQIEVKLEKHYDLETELRAIFNEPFLDPGVFTLGAACKAVSKQYKACISGDGGDELFFGYDKYDKILRRSMLPFVRNSEKSLIDRYIKFTFGANSKQFPQQLLSAYPELRDYDVTAQFHERFFPKEVGIAEAFTLLDIKFFLSDFVLFKSDHVSMRYSVEIRNPFLNLSVATLALQLFSSTHSKDNYKVLLKRIYGEKLPHYIINGKKFGFGVGLPHINSKFNSKNQLKEKLMESMM